MSLDQREVGQTVGRTDSSTFHSVLLDGSSVVASGGKSEVASTYIRLI